MTNGADSCVCLSQAATSLQHSIIPPHCRRCGCSLAATPDTTGREIGRERTRGGRIPESLNCESSGPKQTGTELLPLYPLSPPLPSTPPLCASRHPYHHNSSLFHEVGKSALEGASEGCNLPLTFRLLFFPRILSWRRTVTLLVVYVQYLYFMRWWLDFFYLRKYS